MNMKPADQNRLNNRNGDNLSKPVKLAPDARQGVVVVVPDAGRYLMIRRAEGILAGGSWCFVGGGIEPDEEQACAVRREFAEEVGGVAHPIRKVWEYTRPDGRLLLHWWLARWEPGPLIPHPGEVSEIAWMTIDEIDALDIVLESNRIFMRELGHSLLHERLDG